MKLYMADGMGWTLVSRRPPSVEGDCDHLEFGSVVVVRLTTAGRAFVPLTAGWRILGRSREDYRQLTDPEDRGDLRRATDAAVLTLGHWPSLREHLDCEDASPAVAEVLWELTGVLLERSRVKATAAELNEVLRDVPDGSRIRAETDELAYRAAARTVQLDAVVASHVRHLSRLADETGAFIRQQEALARARELLREADYLMAGDDSPPAFDSARELAERTTAVLTAYRELTS